MQARILSILVPVLLLGACGEQSGPVRSAGAAVPPPTIKAQPTRKPVLQPPPRARVQSLPGLEGVIGATSAELAGQFGTPRLDTWEGDARKLQFSGQSCVLDVFLYPDQPGREPQATYVDARRASDGRDVDRAACVAALRKR